jgi:hypothetical protein
LYQIVLANCLKSISRKPAKDPDNYDDSEVLRMLRNSSINDSGLTSTSRQPDNDIDGNFYSLKIIYF